MENEEIEKLTKELWVMAYRLYRTKCRIQEKIPLQFSEWKL